MKLELPDDAREAFQFLALGIGSLLLVRIVYLAAEHWIAPAADDALGQLLLPFKRGFLIADPHTLVAEQSSPAGRLCRAVLLGIMAGAATGLSAFVIHRALKVGSNASWLAARVGFILCTLVGIWSAIACPPQLLRLDSHGTHVTVRPEVLGLALPYPIERFELPFTGSEITQRHGTLGDGSSITMGSSGEVVVIEPVGSDAMMDSLYAWLSTASTGAH